MRSLHFYKKNQSFNSCFGVSSGGKEGYGSRGRRRGALFMSGLQDPQTSTVDRPRKDQEDQRSGVSMSDTASVLMSWTVCVDGAL